MIKAKNAEKKDDCFFLGHAVDIFRCQTPVDKVLRSQSGCLSPGVAADLPVRELPGNYFLCPLARADDIEPETGFLRIGDVPDVQVCLPDRKYLLRKNDIVLSHSAKLEKLANVGLMHEESLAIPGKNLLVLRSPAIDPIWLFYFLRQLKTREEILAPLKARIPEILGRRGIYREFRNGTEKRILGSDGQWIVNKAEYEKAISQQVFSLLMDDLRMLRVPPPQPAEIEAVNRLHERVLAENDKIKKAREKSRQISEKLNTIFASSLADTVKIPSQVPPSRTAGSRKPASL